MSLNRCIAQTYGKLPNAANGIARSKLDSICPLNDMLLDLDSRVNIFYSNIAGFSFNISRIATEIQLME